jgi:hypothetical protein
MHDTVADGRALRVLTVLDIYSRECVALVAGRGGLGTTPTSRRSTRWSDVSV